MATADGRALIEVGAVGQTFKLPSGEIEILKDINFTVEQGSFTIIYGPSGSGKTTMLNILAGLQLPTTGKVMFEGQNIYGKSGDELAFFRSQTIGLVYQVNYWVKSLSVVENVAMPLYVAGIERAEANRRALEQLKRIELDKYADYRPTVLSGGQQQRVSMARALVADPPLILADEPTGNLDTKNGAMIMDLLKSFQKDSGRTIVLITHNLDYLSYSDSQVHIVDGSIVEGKSAPQTEVSHA